MKILVGIIANDSARYSLFSACVTKLDTEGLDCNIEWLIGGDWCGARNTLVQMTLNGDYTHLWFMDDDHAFHPQLLKQLASHDVPLVNPLCCTRVAPFPLVTYAGKGDAVNQYLPLSLNDEEGTGLVELMAGGCAGMLIRRDVLEAVPAPWFEYTDRSEDILFCEKAVAAGFKLYADLSCRLGHITTAVVYPEISEGRWQTLLNIGQMNVFVESAENWPQEETDEVVPAEQVTEPCLICGAQSTWHDVHGRWGCAAHDPQNDSWATYYERAEIWLVTEENRWYGRVLDGEGIIVKSPLTDRSWTQEPALLEAIKGWFGDLTVFHIADELQDSRNVRQYGPPQRIWSRQPTERN